MFKTTMHNLDAAPESQWTRVIMVSRYKNKWVYCKHKERDTWEIPGGHIENGEDWKTAAYRELFEETGATEANITPVCLYKISTFGLLCFAEIIKLGEIPKEYEIKEIAFFDDEPQNLTYPESHTLMFKTVKKKLKLK